MCIRDRFAIFHQSVIRLLGKCQWWQKKRIQLFLVGDYTERCSLKYWKIMQQRIMSAHTFCFICPISQLRQCVFYCSRIVHAKWFSISEYGSKPMDYPSSVSFDIKEKNRIEKRGYVQGELSGQQYGKCFLTSENFADPITILTALLAKVKLSTRQ